MEETYQTRAIILNKHPWREYDARVVLYSEEKGKMDLIARGAKRIKSKLSAYLEPIVLVDLMVIRGKQLEYVGSALNEKNYSNIKNDLNKLYCVGRIIDIFEKAVNGRESDLKLFNLLKEVLDFIDKNNLKDEKYNILIYFFALKMLSEMGYKPELYNCVVCKKKLSSGGNIFDLISGGVACSCCSEKSKERLTISDNCVKVLRIIRDGDFESLVKIRVDNYLQQEIIKIISSFLQYNLN